MTIHNQKRTLSKEIIQIIKQGKKEVYTNKGLCLQQVRTMLNDE